MADNDWVLWVPGLDRVGAARLADVARNELGYQDADYYNTRTTFAMIPDRATIAALAAGLRVAVRSESVGSSDLEVISTMLEIFEGWLDATDPDE